GPSPDLHSFPTRRSSDLLEIVVNGLQALADSTRNLTPLRPEKVGPEPITPLDAEALRASLEERAAGLSKYAARLKSLAAYLLNRSEEHTSELQSRRDLVC